MPTKLEAPQKLLDNAKKQIESCLSFRKPRFDEIKRSEDAYFGKTKPALKGRFNIPLPIVEGYVETLMSKIDDSIKVAFKKGRESTLKAAKKVSAAWEKDSAPDRGAYNEADLDTKKFAIFAGFGTFYLQPQARPYMQYLSAIDHYDLLFEPLGGRDLDKHLFKGHLNIFKSKDELIKGVASGEYDRQGVEKLQQNVSEQRKKKYTGDQEQKFNRFHAMKLDPNEYAYVGDDIYNLSQLITKWKGEDYYLLWDYELKIPVKFRKLGVFAYPLQKVH